MFGYMYSNWLFENKSILGIAKKTYHTALVAKVKFNIVKMFKRVL